MSWIADLVNKGGGWAAFLAFLFWGGRVFMALARDFSSKVVSELGHIREAIVGQERRVDSMVARLDTVNDTVQEHGQKIERLTSQLAQHQRTNQ